MKKPRRAFCIKNMRYKAIAICCDISWRRAISTI